MDEGPNLSMMSTASAMSIIQGRCLRERFLLKFNLCSHLAVPQIKMGKGVLPRSAAKLQSLCQDDNRPLRERW